MNLSNNTVLLVTVVVSFYGRGKHCFKVGGYIYISVAGRRVGEGEIIDDICLDI